MREGRSYFLFFLINWSILICAHSYLTTTNTVNAPSARSLLFRLTAFPTISHIFNGNIVRKLYSRQCSMLVTDLWTSHSAERSPLDDSLISNDFVAAWQSHYRTQLLWSLTYPSLDGKRMIIVLHWPNFPSNQLSTASITSVWSNWSEYCAKLAFMAHLYIGDP